MYSFKVIESAENPMESIIEKTGITSKFTVQDVVDHMGYTEKVLRESKAQLEAEDMQNKLAVEILPMLKDIPEDKMQLVMAYSSRLVQRPVSIGVIETSEKTLASYKEQLAQIKEECGIDYEAKPEEPKVEEVKEDGE